MGAGDSVSRDEKSAIKRGNWWEELSGPLNCRLNVLLWITYMVVDK